MPFQPAKQREIRIKSSTIKIELDYFILLSFNRVLNHF